MKPNSERMIMARFNQSYFVGVLLVLLAVLLALTAPAWAGMTAIQLDPRQTYLLTNDDPQALDAIPVDLATLGLSSGMKIELQVTGTACYYWDGTSCQLGPFVPWSVAGVFSSGSQLGPSNMLNRVYGAIASDGQPVFTLPTYLGNIPTDIAQDFSIVAVGDSTSALFTVVTVPEDARFLFININDSFYGDNYSTDLTLHIGAVPESDSLMLLGTGVLGLAGALRRKLS